MLLTRASTSLTSLASSVSRVESLLTLERIASALSEVRWILSSLDTRRCCSFTRCSSSRQSSSKECSFSILSRDRNNSEGFPLLEDSLSDTSKRRLRAKLFEWKRISLMARKTWYTETSFS